MQKETDTRSFFDPKIALGNKIKREGKNLLKLSNSQNDYFILRIKNQLNFYTELTERLVMNAIRILLVRRMLSRRAYWLLLLFISLPSCSPIQPTFGFDFSNEKPSASLSVNSNVEFLNLSNSAKTTLSGRCTAKSKIYFHSPIEFNFECSSDGDYSKEFDFSSLPDGVVSISLEEKNSFGELFYAQKNLTKDMVNPSLVMNQPDNLGPGITSINIDGSCSEEGELVLVSEENTGKSKTTACTSSLWSMTFDLGTDLGITSFLFHAEHSDKAKNKSTAVSSSVSRTVVGDFSIAGVSHSGAGPFTDLLKGQFNNFYISWSLVSGNGNYSLEIFQFNSSSGTYDISRCTRSGISPTVTLLNLTSCSLSPGTLYKIKMITHNSLSSEVTRYFNFSTRALPRWKVDAKKLYVKASFSAAPTTNINYSDLIEDYDSAYAPYTITPSGLASNFASILTTDTSNQKLSIAPSSTRVSGMYSGNYTIVDNYGNTSNVETVNFYLAMSFSWAGIIDNDFNKAGNWCGEVSLKLGCLGSAVAPSISSKVVIDDICLKPTSTSSTVNCAAELSANTEVHSFIIKTNSFDQKSYSFGVGNEGIASVDELARNQVFFLQTGGTFGNVNSSGSLTLLNKIEILGGLFVGPKNGSIIFNTIDTGNGIDFVKISNKNYFLHNGSTIKFVDIQGSGADSASVNFNVAQDLEIYNLTVDSDAGNWGIRSSNLIISGDIRFQGRIKAGVGYPMLAKYDSNSKITLSGKLLCAGKSKGGNLPIFLGANVVSTYKVTDDDCKFPPLYLTGNGAVLSEDSNSVYDLKLESLKVTSGNNFMAPLAGRKLRISSEYISDGEYAFYSQGGFSHNNGTVIFENKGSNIGKVFKIHSDSFFYNLNFINNVGTSVNSFNLVADVIAMGLSFDGVTAVALKGSGHAISTSSLVFNKGLVATVDTLAKIQFLPNGTLTNVIVNTSDRINVLNFEILGDSGFLGSSSIFNLSGTNIILNGHFFDVTSGQTLRFNTATESISADPGGTTSPGNL